MAARDEAVERLAKVVKEVAGDWGWKGGKPGEITGGEIMKLVEGWRGSPRISAEIGLTKVLVPFFEKLRTSSNPNVREVVERAYRYKDTAGRFSPEYTDYPEEETAIVFAKLFREMERAGIPRAYTGKLMPLRYRIRGKDFPKMPKDNPVGSTVFVSKYLGELIRGMTPEQVDTLVSLYPRWTGTLEQAATAAKKLYRRPS